METKMKERTKKKKNQLETFTFIAAHTVQFVFCPCWSLQLPWGLGYDDDNNEECE